MGSLQPHGNVTRSWIWLIGFCSFNHFCQNGTRNVSVIGAFSSVGFDFITKWMWSVVSVSHILAEPQSRKTKAYSSTRWFVYCCCHFCVVWPLFKVWRCWSLRWSNENLYIKKESTQSNALRGCLFFMCDGFITAHQTAERSSFLFGKEKQAKVHCLNGSINKYFKICIQLLKSF